MDPGGITRTPGIADAELLQLHVNPGLGERNGGEARCREQGKAGMEGASSHVRILPVVRVRSRRNQESIEASSPRMAAWERIP